MQMRWVASRAVMIAGMTWSLGGGTGGAVMLPVEIDTFVSPGSADQMECSPEHGLLFLRNSWSAIRILDTHSRTQIELHMANERFTDMDLTPDERYLYVADYGTSLRQHYVHRYDLVNRTWEVRLAPALVYRIEAVDADRFLLQEGSQHVDMMLNLFGPQVEELSRIRADYCGDFEYDHTTGRVIHGCSGSSSREIHARRIVGNTLVMAEDTGVYGSAQEGGGTCVLSTDCQNFYYGRLQVEALDVTNNRNYFPELIYAASAEIAFGSEHFYDAWTGEELGTLGFSTEVYGISDDGTELWAFQDDGDLLHRYTLIPEPAALSLLAVCGLLLTRRRRSSCRNPVSVPRFLGVISAACRCRRASCRCGGRAGRRRR
jgi:hypothetical protein